MGLLYINLEVFANAIEGYMVGSFDLTYWSLAGFSSVWMFALGGILGLALGLINEIKMLRKIPYYITVLLSGLVITIIELIFGLILNVWLGLNIWEYNDHPFNLYGQITLFFIIMWIFLAPFAFWLDDLIRYYYSLDTLEKKERPQSILYYYIRIDRFKRK